MAAAAHVKLRLAGAVLVAQSTPHPRKTHARSYAATASEWAVRHATTAIRSRWMGVPPIAPPLRTASTAAAARAALPTCVQDALQSATHVTALQAATARAARARIHSSRHREAACLTARPPANTRMPVMSVWTVTRRVVLAPAHRALTASRALMRRSHSCLAPPASVPARTPLLSTCRLALPHACRVMRHVRSAVDRAVPRASRARQLVPNTLTTANVSLHAPPSASSPLST